MTSPAWALRTAADNAAFFLPHLQPGMRLLDLGCGPGSITVGLAAAVAPGETVGVDLRPSAPDGRVTLITADVHELPFPDASFDAIFSQALLQHVADPLAVLREARRVAKPGAVIGVRDCDWDGQLLAPPDPLLDRSIEVLRVLRAGTSPYVGKHLRGLITEAGFADVTASASVLYYGDSDSTAGAGEFHASLFADEPDLAEAWRDWGIKPGAFLARFWCEVVAYAQ